MLENIKRVLVYTHNSIGLGHAFRTLAVITGIKKWRPDIDFLVMSGTSIPQIFFAEDIEVVKLPSIKLDIDRQGSPMASRYLSGFELENIFDFRQRIILDCFDFFQPDVLIVEHNMTGQMSELIPLLTKKWMRKGGAVDFILAHVCRGIMRWIPLLNIPYQNPRHKSESINLGELYDSLYVLEDREVIDINREFLGNDPALETKIKYLGKVTNKTYEELPSRTEVLDKFRVPDKPLILVSLGRNNQVKDLITKLLISFKELDVYQNYQVAIVRDPYMRSDQVENIKQLASHSEVRFLPFIPDMVDLMSHCELVIARAGYNTVNEILLTGSRALLVPESHGGGEQEWRAQSIQEDHIKVISEETLLKENINSLLRRMLHQKQKGLPQKFNKYDIGKFIIDDLEKLKLSAEQCRCR